MTANDALKQEAHWQGKAFDATGEMKMRAMTFRPRDDHNRLQCPRCFVKFNMHNPMTCIPSQNDSYDIARCDGCSNTAIIPL